MRIKIEQFTPQSVPSQSYRMHDLGTVNQSNSLISQIAAALRQQGSRYTDLYQQMDADGNPFGLLEIHANDDPNDETRPGLSFYLEERDKMSITGLWPTFRYTTLATYQPSTRTEQFRPRNWEGGIGINPTRDAAAIAKDITRRLIPRYEKAHTNQRQEQMLFMLRHAANLQAKQAIAAAFPGSTSTTSHGETEAQSKHGDRPQFVLKSSQYDQRIELKLSGLSLAKAIEIIEDLKQQG